MNQGEPPNVEPGPDAEEPTGVPPRPDLAAMRRSYDHGALVEAELAADPLEQFRRWLDDAVAAGVPEPNAMVLATADADGTPSARTVLLKSLDERGLTFYTNLESDKAADLAVRPVAAVVFPWHAMARQVRVAGTVSLVDREEVAAYFESRPWESQLGAWASRQSRVVPDRATLDREYAAAAARWPEGISIPVPDYWGGYRIQPRMFEFWQGRKGRLHDRIRYRRVGDRWVMERLAP